MTPIPLSVVILSHNEATNLPRCIASVRRCAEVVVVDDGSADNSQAVASQCGARVVIHPYTSFADQRNWAMDNASLHCDWTLHLDADEVMTPQSLEEIANSINGWSSGQVGFIARKVMLDDRWLRFSADYPVYVPRVIHHNGPRYVMRGHGEIIDAPQGSAILLKESMLHYQFSKGWPEWWERHRRYAQAEADRIAQGLPPVAWHTLWTADSSVRRAALRAMSYRWPARPFLRFLYAYVLRMGFLDGRPGYAFCRAMAVYERMISDALRNRLCTSS
jgi:glycosyltransferase involved in cell wall biosynthesis